MAHGLHNATEWNDDFELNGERIYEDEDGRVHLSERDEGHDVVFCGYYVSLPRGTFENLGEGSSNALSYVWDKFDGQVELGKLERFLLMARIMDLTKQRDDFIRLYNEAQGR